LAYVLAVAATFEDESFFTLNSIKFVCYIIVYGFLISRLCLWIIC
jgi:hypothetical protein